VSLTVDAYLVLRCTSKQYIDIDDIIMSKENETRLEEIIRKLTENKELVNGSRKGSIEVNYSDSSTVVTIKIVI